MYGVIGRFIAVDGKRDELLSILLENADGQMPGCRSYVVALCQQRADGIWVTEVWDDRESHAASLELLSVKDAIARARPLIAGFDNRFETTPRGGLGV